MGLPAGSTVRLSPCRRLMCDLLHFSRQVPLVAIERRMRLREVINARGYLPCRPSWFALFTKAYALVSQGRAELRRAYLPLPWPRLHQHECNVAHVAIARQVEGEEAVLGLQVRHPEQMPLANIDDLIRRARTEPVAHFGDFRRQLRIARWPRPVRRLLWRLALHVSGNWRAKFVGTFGVTSVGSLGSFTVHLLSPLTTTVTYGVFENDGSVLVRLFYDHRVLDGVGPAEALRELEETLHGPILQELHQLRALAA